ncbi:MAG: YraN family protein [Micavibrio aeruginosavorus]|nr:YraN family protein [Micavibrio aeruginosavorus]
MTSYKTGLQAEFLAVIFLRLKGYRILAQRCKTPLGEIDLIARRGKTLVFVEVKTRGTIAAALESVSARQAGRIVRAAQCWLASRNAAGMDLRFDVIAIEFPFKIKHIESAFTA